MTPLSCKEVLGARACCSEKIMEKHTVVSTLGKRKKTIKTDVLTDKYMPSPAEHLIAAGKRRKTSILTSSSRMEIDLERLKSMPYTKLGQKEEAKKQLESFPVKVHTNNKTLNELELEINGGYDPFFNEWKVYCRAFFSREEWIIKAIYKRGDKPFFASELFRFLFLKATVHAVSEIKKPEKIVLHDVRNNETVNIFKKQLKEGDCIENTFFEKEPLGKFIKRVLNDFELSCISVHLSTDEQGQNDIVLTVAPLPENA